MLVDGGLPVEELIDAERVARAGLLKREQTAAHSGDNHLPLLWPFYKSHRATILRMVRMLDL